EAQLRGRDRFLGRRDHRAVVSDASVAEVQTHGDLRAGLAREAAKDRPKRRRNEIVVRGARPGQVLGISAYAQRWRTKVADDGDQGMARTRSRSKGSLEQRILYRESEGRLADNLRGRARSGGLAAGGAP